MSALAAEALSVARSYQMRHAAILEAARTDPKIAALYAIWLLATDTSHDASPAEMDDALTRIDRIAKKVLAL